jgi:hypothetical protein
MIMLRDAFRIEVFVEGGTYHGDTALWAAQHFSTVHTIEADPNLHHQFKALARNPTNIQAHLGSTVNVLPHIVPSLVRPSIFWLDSHWSAGATYGEGAECPLLTEINNAHNSCTEHPIFIDDARYFLHPPPPPHDASHWPTIGNVFDALRDGGRRPYILVHSDVIICVPNAMETTVREWCGTAHASATERPLGLWHWIRRRR